MQGLLKIMKPSSGVFVILFLLFLFYGLIELSTLSTRTSTMSSQSSVLLNVFRWPDYVAQKFGDRYLETRIPYDEQLYQDLSNRRENRIVRYESASRDDYMIVYKRGGWYALLRIVFFTVFGVLFIANLYLLALILYWLGRGVRHLFRRQ